MKKIYYPFKAYLQLSVFAVKLFLVRHYKVGLKKRSWKDEKFDYEGSVNLYSTRRIYVTAIERDLLEPEMNEVCKKGWNFVNRLGESTLAK